MPDPDQADFAYDPGRDAYRCPEGRRLPRCRVKNAYEARDGRVLVVYQADGEGT